MVLRLLAFLVFGGALFAAEPFVVSAPTSAGRLQIHYIIMGDFGGFSTSINGPSGDGTYLIPVEHDGKPAKELRMVLFANGCQIQTFAEHIDATTERHAFVCVPLPTVTLKGRISPPPEDVTGLDVLLDYDALWEHSLFGVIDGFILPFRLGQAPIAKDGRFSIEIPDFSKGPATLEMKDATLRASLIERTTLNRPGSLMPQAVKIAASYADEIVFTRRP